MNLEKLFEKLEISVVDKDQDLIDVCTEWFQGNVKDFHEWTDFQGVIGEQKRYRSSLGMGKVGPEIWADSMWNPETFVELADKVLQSWLDEKFDEIDFNTNMNNLVEMYFAQGMGATVAYEIKEGVTDVNFFYANQIFPFKYNNDECVSCAFVSQYDSDTTYVNIHTRLNDGKYKVENRFFQDGDNDVINEIEVDGVEKEILSDVKLFQIYKPAIANNSMVGSPIGMSINANAIEELKAVDLAFTGLTTETKNGRMKIYLTSGAMTTEVDGNKKVATYNPNQEEYYYLEGDESFDLADGGKTFLYVQAPTLRIQAFIDSLNTALNLYGRKIGLGDNQFHSDNGTIYTNTEQVVSTNSKFYKTRMKHARVIENGVKQLVKALYYLENGNELDETISVQFDDSIIHDEQKENSFWERMLTMGNISKIEFWQQTQGFTQDEAIAFEQKQIDNMNLDTEIEFEEGENI